MAFGLLLILWAYSTGIAIGPFLGEKHWTGLNSEVDLT